MQTESKIARLSGILAILFFVMVIAPYSAQAASVQWTGSNGDGLWSMAGNWNPGVPGAGDDALIQTGDAVALDADGQVLTLSLDNGSSLGQSSSTLLIGDQTKGTYGALSLGNNTSTSTGTYTLNNGFLTVSMEEYIGNNGSGLFFQDGGTHTLTGAMYVGLQNGSYGEYNMAGGSLSASDHITLGTNEGSTGVFNLSNNGVVTAAYVHVGRSGAGTFTQTGGSLTTGALKLGVDSTVAVGTYNLSQLDSSNPATLTVNGDEWIGVNGKGTFTQTGGAHTVGGALVLAYDPGSQGTYTLSGDASTLTVSGTAYIGMSGTGTFTQNGGTNNAGSLYIGLNGGSGTYNLHAGSLSVGWPMVVGETGQGVFNQYDGSNTASSLFIGDSPGSTGTYNLYGGTLTVQSYNTMSMGGTAVFKQTGGTFNAQSGLTLGGWASSGSATYNMSQLDPSNPAILNVTGNLNVGDYGTGTFNQGGGTSTVSGDLVLSNSGGTGTYNLSGDSTVLNVNFNPGGNNGAPNGALIVGNAGMGSFTQGTDLTDNNNQVNVAGDLTLGQQSGSLGQYTLNSGTLTVGGQLAVGGQGTGYFTQNGGTLNLTGLANGPYGTDPDYVNVGSSGFGAWGGALAIGGGVGNGDGSNSGGTGTYMLNSGVINTYNLLVGATGTGTMYQYGGTVTTTILQTGFSGYGTYNLYDGVINAYSEMVGFAANGTFNQFGGTNAILTDLNVGYRNPGNSLGQGTYNLTGGTLSSGNTTVGAGEQGDFVNTNATHNITGNLVVGDNTTATNTDGTTTTCTGTGTYTINGDSASLSIGFVLGGNGVANPALSNGFSGWDSNGQPTGAYGAPNGALIIGNYGTGTFTQGYGSLNPNPNPDFDSDNNTVYVAGDLVLGNHQGSQGTYILNNGTLTVDGKMVVGGAGTGTFTQNGGQVTVTGYAPYNPSPTDYVGVGGNSWSGWLLIGGGTASGLDQGTGTYTMNGGYLSASGISVGSSGVGTFNQNGDSSSVSIYSLYVGNCGGCNDGNALGTYNLKGGILDANNELIGIFGHGLFVQTGGTNKVETDLQIATGPFPTPEINLSNPREGSYELDGGQLLTNNTIVGVQGVGIFTQNGGLHQVKNNLVVGQQYTMPSVDSNNPNLLWGGAAPGTYNMAGGTLTAGNAIIVGDAGNGTFIQTGGSVTVGSTTTPGNLFVGGSGTYPTSYTYDDGGNPQPTSFGTYQGNGTYTLNASAPTDGSSNLLVNGDLVVGWGGTGLFNHQNGLVTVVGNLALGAAGAQLVTSQDVYGNPTGFFTYNGTGTYNLSGGSLSVGQNEYVGQTGTGTFTQTGGTHTISGDLVLGNNSGSTGTYNLIYGGDPSAGGAIGLNVAGDAYVGVNGIGTFNQGEDPVSGLSGDGGRVFIGGNLYIDAMASSSTGTYNLYGGALEVGQYELIGNTDFGYGYFNQYDGTHKVDGALNIGNSQNSNGQYQMTGGSLSVGGAERIGVFGNGYFTQTGGTHTVGGDFVLGNDKGSYGQFGLGGDPVYSTLTVKGGALVGNSGKGYFVQTGGTATITGQLNIGQTSTGIGTYELDGGALSVGSDEHVGVTGTGYFTQTAGTHKVGGDLVLGNDTGSNGQYSLTGDASTLSVKGNAIIGMNGSGTFAQSGGSNTVTGTLTIAANPGSSGTYSLSGGTLNAGAIVNNNAFNFSGGNLNVNSNFTNNASGVFTISGGNPLKVNGSVINNGTTHITTGTTFTGAFTNNGTLITDSSTFTFNSDFTVGSTGSIQASAGDTYQMGAGFYNNSTVPGSWSVGGATIEFLSGAHDFTPGSSTAFSWGTLDLDSGATLNLKGNGYIGYILGLVFGTGESVTDITGNGFNLYYDPTLNPGLDDLTYALGNGGELTPGGNPVPIPGALWLLGSGLACLTSSLRRRAGTKLGK